MARRQGYPYYGKKYLANTNTEEIHDLDKEQDGCKIDEIKASHIKMLDTYSEVESLINESGSNYNGCMYCLNELHTG